MYVLVRDDVPIYVGMTTRPRQRLNEHRSERRDRSLDLRIAATYSTTDIAYRAEVVAWFSLVAAGAPIENERPAGCPTNHRRRTS